MRVPWGLEWPLNWLALESSKDNPFQDWNRNHRPSGGVYVADKWNVVQDTLDEVIEDDDDKSRHLEEIVVE